MASINDRITDVRNAARPNSARVTSPRSVAGATLSCDNLSGWPTASKVHFVTYTVDSNSKPVAGTQLDCYGIVSSNTITSFTVIDGNDSGNQVGDYVEMLPTAAWGQDLADALTAQHSRTGAHVGINNTGGMTTDTLTVSSGTSLPAGDIGSADIADGSITTAKLATGIQPVTVETNPYKFSVFRTAAWNTPNNSTAKVPFDSKTFDTGTNFDVASNNRFTAPIAGFYFLTANIGYSSSINNAYIMFYKNGSEVKRSPQLVATNVLGNTLTSLLQLAANDYIEVWCFTSAAFSGQTTAIYTFFDGFLLSKT